MTIKHIDKDCHVVVNKIAEFISEEFPGLEILTLHSEYVDAVEIDIAWARFHLRYTVYPTDFIFNEKYNDLDYCIYKNETEINGLPVTRGDFKFFRRNEDSIIRVVQNHILERFRLFDKHGNYYEN